MFLFTYSAAILAILFVGFAVFIFIKQRNNQTAVFLALHMLVNALWVGSNAIADVAYTDSSLIFWSGMAAIGASLHISFYLCFVDSFIRKNTVLPRYLLFIYIAPSVVFSILMLLNIGNVSVIDTFFPAGLPAQIAPGIGYQIYPLFLFGGLLYGSVRLLFEYRKTTFQRRKQILYMQIGFAFLFMGSLIFGVILPLLGELRYFSVAPQFTLFFIVLSAYAILRHRLLDIRVVIQRGVIFSVLLIFIISIYLLIVNISALIFERITDVSILIAAGITTVIGALSIQVIEQYLRKLTDPIFFKNQYVYAETIHELSEALHRSVDIETIKEEVSLIFRNRLKAETVEFILNGSNSYGATANISDDHKKVSIPFILDDKHLGVLELGPKMSGEPYSDRDLGLLKTFANQASVAIERSKLYDEVRDYSLELEEKVKERTAEIERLREQERQMMVEISHGLQDPLTVAKAEISLIEKNSPNNKTLYAFDRSIDEISNFITNLLHLARLDKSNVSKEVKTKCNLSVLFEALVEYFEVLAAENNIAIEHFIEPNVYLACEEKRIEELVVNLVSNAIKYNTRDITDKRVYISLRDNDGSVIITIQDTGIGIKEKDIKYVFDRFYRVKNDQKGTGLGLAICKQIAKNHGGSILVQSTYGTGTIFTITL